MPVRAIAVAHGASFASFTCTEVKLVCDVVFVFGHYFFSTENCGYIVDYIVNFYFIFITNN